MKHTQPLKMNYEFRRLYAKGKSAVSPYMAVYFRKNRENTNKLGLTVSTKLGNAVTRNRTRRRLKEIYRLNEDKIALGHDIVVVARVRCKHAEFAALQADFLRLLQKLGLLIGD